MYHNKTVTKLYPTDPTKQHIFHYSTPKHLNITHYNLLLYYSVNNTLKILKDYRKITKFITYTIILVHLNFYFLLVLPRILPFSFEEGSYSPGQYAAAQCLIPVGDLPLYIKWLFNNKPLTENSALAMGVSITKAGKRRSLLTIESIAPYNAGDYVCQGENIVGSAYYKTKLVVNGDWHYRNF